jgi:membrane-bound metal-dependent hydrolase YbcI (DUF457 family)
MFIGHFAVGFASKRVAPKASLGILIAAPILLDLVWPFLLLAGWETVRVDPGNTVFTPLAFDSYPYSHSLAGALVLSGAFALAYLALTRYGRGAAVVFFGVVSHWFLDYATHRPDLPLYPGDPARHGLGLWNHFAATLAIESAMLAIGVWIYAASTKPADRAGRIGLLGYVLLLCALYAGNAFGPPPPDPHTIAVVSLGIWLFPLMAAWIDRHRYVPA